MQIGGVDAGGVGDGLDLRLRAPIAADMGDGAAHDVVIRRRGRQRGEFGEAIGQGCFHGHAHDRYLGRRKATSHPISGSSYPSPLAGEGGREA